MSKDNIVYVKSGIGFGTAIALVLSWTANHSIGWLIVHGFFGWFYVIWRIIT